MDGLIGWATEKGVKLHKLTPQHRHFVVAEDVQAGVPQQLLLYGELALDDAEYAHAFRQLAAELGPGRDARHLLCVLLVLEKAREAQSRWAPYISILPEEYDDPYWWADDQIALVKGTPLSRAIATHYQGLHQITASVQRLEQLYNSSKPPGSPASVLRTYRNGWALKLAAARWARSAVWSRSFTIRMLANGVRNVVAMVPVLDMIDHSPHMEVVWHTGRDGTEPFQFTPLGHTTKGTVMTNNYGRKPSDELLLAYGFLLDHPNPADHFIVSLSHRRAPTNSSQQQPTQQLQQPQQQPQTTDGFGDHIVRVGHTGHSSLFPDHVNQNSDVGDDDLAAQQQAAEDVQRSLLLCSLRLSSDQKLSLADPLPSTLLLGAQICILPFPQLYLWTAHVQNVQRATATMALPGLQTNHTSPPDRKQKKADGYRNMPIDGVSMQQDGFEIDAMDWQDDSNSSLLNGLVGRKRPWQGSEDGRESNRQKSAADGLTSLLQAESAMHIGSQTGAVSGWVARSNGFQHAITTPVHFLYRLQSLVSVKQQLQSRINGMVPDHQTEFARQHGAVHHNAIQNTKHAGSPHHSKLALAYVDTQKNLIRHSMAAVSQHISHQVHAASALVQRCIQQRLITCKPLQPNRAHIPSPSPINHPLSLVNTWQTHNSNTPNSSHHQGDCSWSSIDPDLHLQQYNAWLSSWGLQAKNMSTVSHTLPDGMADGMDGIVSNNRTPNHHTSSSGATAQDGCTSNMHESQLGSCSMQEVVFARTAPPQLIARRASRETLVQPDPPSVSKHSSAQSQQKAVNGRARGPPSSSRTFTMKGAKPAVLPSSSTHTCGEATAALNSNPQPTIASNAAPTNSANTLQTLPNNPLKRVTLPQGLCASLGIDSDYDPVSLGVKATSHIQTGDVLLQVPLQCCLCAPSQQQLISQLMSAANNLLLALAAAVKPVLGPYAAPNMGTGAAMASIRVPMSRPADMLVWHLLHSVAAAPSVRLYASDVEGVQLLVEMLEDSPAAGSYQEVFDTLKTEFTQTKKSVSCKQVADTDTKEAAFIRLLRTPSAFHLYLWSKQVVETCALQVNCPATAPGQTMSNSTNTSAGLVDDPMSIDGQPQPNGQSIGNNKQWVLAPVIASVCNELHQALFVPEIGPIQPTANTQMTQDGIVTDEVSGHALVVCAACELQPDLYLTPLLLLPGLDIEELMTTFGPEALPWHQLLHMSAAAFAARFSPVSSGGGSSSDLNATANHSRNASASRAIERLGSHTNLSVSTPAAGLPHAWQTHLQLHNSNGGAPVVHTTAEPTLQHPVTSGTGILVVSPSNQASIEQRMTETLKSHVAGVLQSRTVLYELYICPGEQDPLGQAKLTLLAAVGLGCVHYLSVDLATEQFVLCALKICLAGKELLQHSLAQQCVALHEQAQKANNSTSSSQQPTEQVQPSSVCGSTGTQLQGDANQSTGSTSVSVETAYGQLHAARSQLLDMLTRLSDDLPVCKAARKQLRQMVHDARKNTRRRLKQLEAVHNVIANHVSGSSNPFRVASATNFSSFGGSYHPLGGSSSMHEGVRLYLACVCDVLDTWADHLGLNRQSDSMSKRHKSRSEDNA